MSVGQQILLILVKNKEVRLQELVEETGASRQMIHRIVKNLVEKGDVLKIGTAPRTFYKLVGKPKPKVVTSLPPDDEVFLHDHFLLITETGTRLSGPEALSHWCDWQHLPLGKTAKEFITTRKKYLQYYSPDGLINGNEKIRSTKGFTQIGLDEVFYLDFYAIERFGKTKLGTLLHFAKQGQNRRLMDEILTLIKDRVNHLVSTFRIEAVGYIPPTIKRELQFMKVLEKKLNIPLPHIGLIKVKGEVTVPQKALSKIKERISNAQFSIMVRERRKFGRVLLLDDAIGSGATMNETALKLRQKGIAVNVIGLAVVGSFKGFDVIQEV